MVGPLNYDKNRGGTPQCFDYGASIEWLMQLWGPLIDENHGGSSKMMEKTADGYQRGPPNQHTSVPTQLSSSSI